MHADATTLSESGLSSLPLPPTEESSILQDEESDGLMQPPPLTALTSPFVQQQAVVALTESEAAAVSVLQSICRTHLAIHEFVDLLEVAHQTHVLDGHDHHEHAHEPHQPPHQEQPEQVNRQIVDWLKLHDDRVVTHR